MTLNPINKTFVDEVIFSSVGNTANELTDEVIQTALFITKEDIATLAAITNF